MNDSNIEELKQLVLKLENENKILKQLLTSNGIKLPPDSISKTANGYSNVVRNENKPPDNKINHEIITEKHALLLYSIFKGRKDVFSKRAVLKEGKSAYFPVCDNFWKIGLCPKRDNKKVKCMDCNNRKWTPLSQRALIAHLQGNKENCTDVIGIYPILPEETCNFLVFDFDNHNSDETNYEKSSLDLKSEVSAVRDIAKKLNIPCLVEKSRSGNGAHIWFIFEEAISATETRKFGSALLTKGAEYVNQKSFISYDRMLPAQDHIPKGGLGNLIALPLQGQAVRKGNSVFIDEQWRPYSNQWDLLRSIKKISKQFVEEKIKEWTADGILGILSENENIKTTPWRKRAPFIVYKEDISNNINIILANQLYIDTTNIKPRLQNTLRRMASFPNPNYYKKLAMGYSVERIHRIISCFRNVNEYIAIPRGKTEQLLELLNKENIPYTFSDKRQTGRKIKVSFIGHLYEEQQKAANIMLQNEMGILSAATAFGKTVVGAYFISHHKVNTLILVHTREIMKNWLEDLNKFLEIDEPLPSYSTPKGAIKKRKSIIGTLFSSHNSLTGIIDIAMISSLGKPGDINQLVKDYGMVIMDECHHGAAITAEEILREVNAKYVFGLTATPKRDDGMEQKVLMQFGGIKYNFTAKDKAILQGITHSLLPRFTNLVNIGKNWNINEAYKELINNEKRNTLIIKDILYSLENGRTPIVLTKFKEHAQILLLLLKDYLKIKSDSTSLIISKDIKLFLLKGGRSTKERDYLKEELNNIRNDEKIIIIAIDKYIGEGFNFPKLDTLFLVTPISWEGNVEQYAGRLNRNYEGKKEVTIYDYVDIHVPILEKMYFKRLRTYKKIGYKIKNQTSNTMKHSESQQTEEEINKNGIYDRLTFYNIFSEDIKNASKEIIIASPGLSYNTIIGFIELAQSCSQRGCKITILTLETENTIDAIKQTNKKNINLLIEHGIYVQVLETLYEHFAIIDSCIVWYGNMNLLSKQRDEDNMIRITDAELSNELLLSTKKK